MTLNEILQDFVNEPYENLVSMAQEAIVRLRPVLDDLSKEEKSGSTILVALMATSLAVDGKLSDLEYQFVCDVLGEDFPREDVKGLAAAHYSDEMMELVDGLVDACSTDLKSTLITFCCCFLAVDETISRDEVAFIQKLCAAN